MPKIHVNTAQPAYKTLLSFLQRQLSNNVCTLRPYSRCPPSSDRNSTIFSATVTLVPFHSFALPRTQWLPPKWRRRGAASARRATRYVPRAPPVPLPQTPSRYKPHFFNTLAPGLKFRSPLKKTPCASASKRSMAARWVTTTRTPSAPSPSRPASATRHAQSAPVDVSRSTFTLGLSHH